MTEGVVLVANNNGHIDYVKQAIFLSKRVIEHLQVPVTIITDSPKYLKNNFSTDHLDNILEIDYKQTNNKRFYFDGAMAHKTLMFKNHSRTLAYFMSPYDKTIVMDTDFILSNSILKKCFDSCSDLMMYKSAFDISGVRDMHEFEFVSDKSVDFYWATVVYFQKCHKNDIYFNLINHIEENWDHYRRVHQIVDPMFRNDFAFSIALHTMKGFMPSNEVVADLPGKHFFTTDKDILWNLDANKMMFLVEKKDYLGEYTAVSVEGLNVHVMNKFSLERAIGEIQ